MTAVEFYDRTPIENVISSLTTVPDKSVFIGDGKVMKRFDSVYRDFLKNRGMNIELVYRSVNKNCINSIAKVLSDIVNDFV
ncbi:MAG: hypothetical protein ACI396_05655 [Acutalibacteraceae bacterium]